MDNKKILKERWQDIDKELSKATSKMQNNILQRVYGILNKYKINKDNLYNYMINSDLSMLRNDLQDVLDLDLSDYLKFKINKMIKRTKIKYKEALELLIEIEYAKMYNRNKKFEDELFTNTITITNEIVQRESCKVLEKPFHLIPVNLLYIQKMMTTAYIMGYTWQEYVYNKIMSDSNKLYRKISVDLSVLDVDSINVLDNYKKSIESDFRRYITALDNEVATLSSQVSLWGMEKQGIDKVIYVAVMDEKTTNICQSMNGQIFNINDWNIYYRYAENNDTRMTKFETKGLKVGENEPALHYNCRSVLYPYK